MHNHENGYLDWLFYQNVIPPRESNSILSGKGKGFTLEEVHSLNSDEVFASIQLKKYLEFSGCT